MYIFITYLKTSSFRSLMYKSQSSRRKKSTYNQSWKIYIWIKSFYLTWEYLVIKNLLNYNKICDTIDDLYCHMLLRYQRWRSLITKLLFWRTKIHSRILPLRYTFRRVYLTTTSIISCLLYLVIFFSLHSK